MIAVLGVGGLLWLVIVALVERRRGHLQRVNDHARREWLEAGATRYPQMLHSGEIVWYDVPHAPVVVRRPFAD